VRLIHPDHFVLTDPARHATASEALKELIAAMRVLRDPVERARYDARLEGRPLGARMGWPVHGERPSRVTPTGE
jgi:curved DNA-binding protein CbpA